MSVINLPTGELSRIICENLKDRNTVFVFSTDVCCSTWAEWCVINSELTGVSTVSLERFIAWDDFKRDFVVAKEENKHSIPSLLRKIFVYNLIKENAATVEKGNPLFKSIINPEYAADGYSFADWISSNLSSLKLWYDRFEEFAKEHPQEVDDEDRDYELLYNKYNEFLGETMFEPSWIKPDFSASSKKFIIFYPEQFLDFDEFEPILSDIENITLVKTKLSETKPVVYKYSDARKELRISALYIRDFVENSNGKITYDQVALHAPELEKYLPYVTREFEKYCIPYVVRSGNPYTINSAGSVFQNIKDCKDSNFSYEAVRALLLNSYIPWKNKELNESLIRLGCEYHCICNYKEGRNQDIWIKALSKSGKDELEKNYYTEIRKAVESLCDAHSFSAIKTAWLAFKNDFLCDDEFTVEANNVLSSCIVLLDELIDLEQEYVLTMNLEVYNPYGFFLTELGNKKYNPQQSKVGVNIFDYKVAACSAFKYNVVINCSQTAVSISKKQLSFLNNQKRMLLGIKDSDIATNVYISLYGKFNTASEANTIYSYSEDSFSGFAIPHSFFAVEKASVEKYDQKDFYKQEKNWFLSQTEDYPLEISDSQKNQFKSWSNISDFSKLKNEQYKLTPELEENLNYVLSEKRSKDDESYVKITQSDMKSFFPCPRFWLLKSVLKLKEDSLDTNLIDSFAQGNINHKALELIVDEFKNRWGKLPVYEGKSFGDLQNEVLQIVKQKVNESIHDSTQSFITSPLSVEVLESQESLFVDIILNFLKKFCGTSGSNAFGGYTIVDTEKWIAVKNKDGVTGIGGKIDCILSDPDGNVVIVDYKTGTPPTITSSVADEEKHILEDFQCAAYVTLYNRYKDNSVKVSKMIFSSITTDKNVVVVDEFKTGQSKAKVPEDYEFTLKVFDEYVDFFSNQLSNKAFVPVMNGSSRFNNLNVYSDCIGCTYKSICRTSFTVANHSITKRGSK